MRSHGADGYCRYHKGGSYEDGQNDPVQSLQDSLDQGVHPMEETLVVHSTLGHEGKKM